MNYNIVKELETSPSLPRLFRQAAVSGITKRKKRNYYSLPDIKIHLNQIKATPSKLHLYSRTCGFNSSHHLPITYPHVLAFPLHMELMVADDFPFPVIGLVHVKNTIKQYRTIENAEEMQITCYLSDLQEVEKGREFDIVTQVYIAQELVWESTSTMLRRTLQATQESPKAPVQKEDFHADSSQTVQASESLGRDYAKASGDFNLIHLHSLTAKLFGFNKAIAHGMWAKARCLAELNSLLTPPVEVSVRFKLPLFLPATVVMQQKKVADSTEFELVDATGEKPHLAGVIRSLPQEIL